MSKHPIDSWSTVKLQEITTKIGSGATPRGGKESYQNSGITLIRSLNVYDFIFEYDGLAFIDEKQAKQLSNVEVQNHDILLNITGASVARCCMVPSNILPARVNQHVTIVRVNSKIASSHYVLYCINSPQLKHHLLSLAQGGATREALTKDTISNFEIPFPSLSIQNKIAAILSNYDRLIENNTRRIEILEQMARSLYNEWFVKFRFPGYEQTKMVNSELGLIPEGWEVKPLSDVCLRITDGSHWSPTTVDKGYPMASVKDMQKWDFQVAQCRKISVEDYNKLVRNDCKPLKGDVLVAKDGSYLKHIFVTNKERELVILSSIALLRPNEKIIPHLLSFYLLQPSIKARMAGYVSGVALPRIILKDFREFSIVLSPLTLQKQFFAIVEPVVASCHNLIEKNLNLRQTRDLLLPKLISGEIDVENLDIETEVAA